MTSSSPINSKSTYFVVSPDGRQIAIPSELFGLLWDFLEGNKQTGSIIVQFRNGGVAGLESFVKKTYK